MPFAYSVTFRTNILRHIPNLSPHDVARHKALCDALRQLGADADIAGLTTQEVVAACRAAVPDADSDEILAALRAVGRPV
jgi:hypothetical protein